MKRQKPNQFGFGVNQCSLCNAFALTVGDQKYGGVRYCEGCLKSTLAWHQWDEQARDRVLAAFEKVRGFPSAQKALALVADASEELRQAYGQGESVRRCYDAMLAEWDGE